MIRKFIFVLALVLALSVPATAQDAKTVLSNAAKALGLENVNSVMYYGSGANFTLGQSNNSNGAWPRTNLNDYTRAIDFGQSVSRATAVTFAAPVTGGPPVQAPFNQNITAANNGERFERPSYRSRVSPPIASDAAMTTRKTARLLNR